MRHRAILARASFGSGTVRLAGSLAVALSCWPALAAGPFLNGFDLANAIIPASQIVRGGPPRDGIPAIDQPKFIDISDASYMQDDDLVIAVDRNGISRAYPLRIMLWHEIANDRIGNDPVTVTYCPLCGTSVVFDANVDGQAMNFGVSGLLFQSDVLMYDRQTQSLWSQLAFKAVTGPQVGKALKWLPSQIMTWTVWKKKHPSGSVLSTNTGFARDYTFNPYENYQQSARVWFGVPNSRQDFSDKTWILGILLNGQAKAYALDQLPSNRPVIDLFQSADLRVQFDAASQEATVVSAKTSEVVPFTLSYWFAWQAFYPETEVWRPIAVNLDRHLQLTVNGEKGKTYVLEESSDLSNWRVVSSVVTPDGTAQLSLAGRGGARQFYRTRLSP